MSIFPAYAHLESTEILPEKKEWLQNSSFVVDTKSAPTEHINENNSTKKNVTFQHPSRKISKRLNRTAKKPFKTASNTQHDYFVDKLPTREFLSVKTISRPSVSKYSIKCFITSLKHRKQRKFKRYYNQCNVKKIDSEVKIITKQNIDSLPVSSNREESESLKQEEELSRTTAVYNKQLSDTPNDVGIWLKYVEFQDTMYAFEKTYKKGSVAKGLRVNAERKLAILDKALYHNINSEQLLRKRLDVVVNVYPADELQTYLKNLVEKDQGNIILWQGYIEATQCSMSHCNSSSVLGLYTKCLSVLHKIRRNVIVDKYVLEENILKILYQCGLFLRQSGLFEQLWTLLRMYLELNLSPTIKNKFNIPSKFNEHQLEELEELVFKSQLPSHELWLRTEKLRESCHWVPYNGNSCEDPQRLVFTDDVASLIHPITMPENTFKLTATILTLLKIPLLPCRHSTMQEMGLDYVPWALDSVENFLPIFFPIYPIELTLTNFLIDNRLAVGPQYLKVLPGQEEYLDFILTVMQNCADCLSGNDRVSVIIWWMRFQRLLIILEKTGRFKVPQTFKKRIKTNIKTLLKLPENRDNIIFYCEYAMIEKELNGIQNSFSILETALSMKSGSSISIPNISENQTEQCYLVRMLVENVMEMEIDEDLKKKKILIILANYVLPDHKNVTELDLQPDLITEVTLKFKHITMQLLQNALPRLPSVQHFLPSFYCDWIICNGWLIYMTTGILDCGVFLEMILKTADQNNSEKLLQKELIFEFYVGIMYKHCPKQPGMGLYKILDDILHRAVESYPNNLFLLSILAKQQSSINVCGPPWWKIKNLLLKTGHGIPILFLIFITHKSIMDLQDTIIDTATGAKFEINTNMKNRILSLFRVVTRSDMCTRRCGLIWRLYLQFVHRYCEPKICRNIYYSAVEECPWLKALYMDAAIYIPQDLNQIQDLIIEKELRLHVTPEELDILRD